MLRTPPKPLPLRLALRLFEFCASLTLAVVLIFTLAFVLAMATFVESAYGTQAVQFGIYGAWWFTLLGALLAVNIFCAAAIRYPWKRYQTGFVITHIGLLTLLFGCLLSRRGGIDAQMPVFEDGTNHLAFADTQHFELTVHWHDPSGDRPRVETLEPPPSFVGGPFNWQELRNLGQWPTLTGTSRKAIESWIGRVLLIPVWRMARVDRGVVLDQDGIELEVLDYYSSSAEVEAPLVDLKISNPRMPAGFDDQGREQLGEQTWTDVRLSISNSSSALIGSRPFGVGARQRMGGGFFVFQMTGAEAQQQAFLNSRPEMPLGPRGQVVLFADGQRHTIDVEQQVGGDRIELGGGLWAELVEFYGTAVPAPGSDPGELQLSDVTPDDGQPERPAVEIRIGRGEDDEQPARMVLFADYPELDLQDYAHDVFGSYWYDHGEKDAQQRMQGEGGSRIDILQGADQKLYYRYWNGHEVVALDELPTDGTPVDAFKMPIAQLTMHVDQFVPAERPEPKLLPRPFDREMTPTAADRAAHLRMTVDGHTEEFWLLGRPPELFAGAPSTLQTHTVESERRSVTVRMPLDEVDVGFQVRLKKFERQLDPGTTQPSDFSSLVDFLEPDAEPTASRSGVMYEKALIGMNAPVDFSDPARGRSYRLFQEAFRGPFPRGSALYERNIGDRNRDQLYLSILTVNYDPGRGVKYLGSLLIVAGIVTMFYMRAYFFKPRRRTETSSA